jgi:hypothetical protein
LQQLVSTLRPMSLNGKPGRYLLGTFLCSSTYCYDINQILYISVVLLRLITSKLLFSILFFLQRSSKILFWILLLTCRPGQCSATKIIIGLIRAHLNSTWVLYPISLKNSTWVAVPDFSQTQFGWYPPNFNPRNF